MGIGGALSEESTILAYPSNLHPNTLMEYLSLVVPTKDRREDLLRMLASLASQTRLPDQVIIVDGSDPPIEDAIIMFVGLAMEYVRVFPPSLALQRNAGMARLRPGITLAGYLDDDVVLEPDAIENMLTFWEASGPEVGGAAFNIVNNPVPGGALIKRLFGIDSPVAGRMLASGFPSTICSVSHDLDTDWLYGGATIWRRSVIEQYPYDEWFVGMGFMEDVDYSFTVRFRYRLKVVADAKLAHYSRPVREDRQALLGTWQIVNRMYLVRKHEHRGLSAIAAWWASFGLILLNLGFAALRVDKRYLKRAIGNLNGVASELRGRRPQLGGHLK